jgi:hypothetical protein
MTVTQTVEIPASHKLVIDVPSKVPAGPVVLTFAPAKEAADQKPRMTAEEEAEFFKQNADWLNKQVRKILSSFVTSIKSILNSGGRRTVREARPLVAFFCVSC